MAIKIFDLFHVYNQKTDIENVALKGVSLDLGDHFFAALVGKTGSGKSTLAQHLNYLLKPNSGSIEIEDFKISSNKDLWKNCGVVIEYNSSRLINEIVSDTFLIVSVTK